MTATLLFRVFAFPLFISPIEVSMLLYFLTLDRLSAILAANQIAPA